jgi:23S rRNA pseudouridine1911/1915/1917 synthase
VKESPTSYGRSQVRGSREHGSGPNHLGDNVHPDNELQRNRPVELEEDEDALTARVPDGLAGRRLDQVLAALFPDYSRSRLQQWVRAGQVTVDGRARRPRDPVRGGEWIELGAQVEEPPALAPEAIPLDIVHEDADLLVLSKPAGLVVHPAAGNWQGTLANALLHHDRALGGLPRVGLVHRLDKDTSGLLVVARNLTAHKRLVEQLQARTVTREYDAVVVGELTGGGSVTQPIGRHPVDRKRMAVTERGRPAVTHYRLAERFPAHCWLKVRLETGRTHQIRVHMAYLHHPLVGDPVYGGRLRLPPRASPHLVEVLSGFRRQALHASRLALVHPRTGATMEWQASLPSDMAQLIRALREDASTAPQRNGD